MNQPRKYSGRRAGQGLESSPTQKPQANLSNQRFEGAIRKNSLWSVGKSRVMREIEYFEAEEHNCTMDSVVKSRYASLDFAITLGPSPDLDFPDPKVAYPR